MYYKDSSTHLFIIKMVHVWYIQLGQVKQSIRQEKCNYRIATPLHTPETLFVSGKHNA